MEQAPAGPAAVTKKKSGGNVQVRAGQKQPKGASKSSKKTVGNAFISVFGLFVCEYRVCS